MYTDIRVQELHHEHARIEQEKKAAMKDMIRIAQAGQPAQVTRLRSAIGGMLITFGEALRRQSADLDRTVAVGSRTRSVAR